MTLEIKDRDAAGRICTFSTNHGKIQTPTLLPVINPKKMPIAPNEMKKLFGAEIVITNAYIIHEDATLKQHALEKGVHDLIGFNGPVMTDSGTFQSYMYGEVDVDPLEIVRFQQEIGSDIGTILDIFGTPDQSKKKARQGVQTTIQRAHKSIPLKKEMLLACPIQGSVFPDLRTRCAEALSKIDAGVFPIGGVVPLMESQRYTDLVRVILAAKKGLDPSKPVHLFGAGHPMIFPLAVALGCDLFDSSAYIKYAKDGRMLFPWGTQKLEDLSTLPCSCPICSQYTIKEMKQLSTKEKLQALAHHNLYISFTEIRKIKAAISEGTLWELVERRATANPHLLQAMKELRKPHQKKWLSTIEPISKNRAEFYTGSHTTHRPLVYRIYQRMQQRYSLPYKKTVLLEEMKKPYAQTFSEIHEESLQYPVNFIVTSALGPVPLELSEMYPFAQSEFPKSVDPETCQIARKRLHAYIKDQDIIPVSDLKKIKTSAKPIDFDKRHLNAVAAMQFGRQASNALFNGKIRLVKSKNTGKVRNVYLNNKHVLSLRAEDGFFTLKIAGGQLLHKAVNSPQLRVTINDDAVPFVKEGKSVFAKFVIDCDPDLVPGDECLIVDTKDQLIAVGKALLNHQEMLSFSKGVAVQVRESILSKH